MATDGTRRELYDTGLRVRKEVVGAEYVARAVAGTNEFTGPLQELVTEYCWGAVWTRAELDRRTRSLITLGMLVALNRSSELATHVRGALTNGATPEQIREALLQTMVYVGVPAAVEAFRVAGPIIEEYTDG